MNPLSGRVPEAISRIPRDGIRRRRLSEGFPYRGSPYGGFATETLSRRKVNAGPHEGPGINETSSGDVEEVPMPSATLDLAASTSVAGQVANLAKPAAQPIIPTPAAPPSLGEGCDLSSLLTFDPESIEPATPKASEEPSPGTVHGPLQRLKALLSSSVEILVENPEAIKGILDEIQPHLPVTLQVKLWPAVTLSAFKSRVQSARQRITLRHAQLPLRADIAEKCQRLNEKKTALDAKTDTSANNAETLRKELESLEEKVRMTKQLIQEKETFIARSREEAQGLTADLKTDLAEIRALSSQLVTGKDEDDETEIAEVDRIRLTPFALSMNFFRRTSLCKPLNVVLNLYLCSRMTACAS
ncbi:hypothetical protein QYE76_000767 [Lolium multiflorum]|uniref:Uncharacterized protein n=1 Tax=Lolium multiflorum TaxID=4521 RepID=A0AAD8RKS0_LOLMU|nr:hypothetical protein QYE76_000767 [Lolium multiflorum]